MSGYGAIFGGSGSAASVVRLMRAYDDIDPDWLTKGFLALADGSREDFDVDDLEMFRLMAVSQNIADKKIPDVHGDLAVKTEVSDFEKMKIGVSRYADDKTEPMVIRMGGFDDSVQWTKRRLDDEFFPEEVGDRDELEQETQDFLDKYASLEDFYKDRSTASVEGNELVMKMGMHPAPIWDESESSDELWKEVIAMCIPPTEGKTSLVKKYPLWFEDCDDLLAWAILNDPSWNGSVGNLGFQAMYRDSAYNYGNRKKILLTNGPGCVPAPAYCYVFLLCKCNSPHPHDGYGLTKPFDRGKRKRYYGKIWFFSSYEQRNFFAILIAKAKFQGQVDLIAQFLKVQRVAQDKALGYVGG